MIATMHDSQGRTARRFLVAEVMSRKVLLLRARMRLEPAVELLVDHGFSGAPVIDQRGRLIGMLHAIDIAVMHLLPVDDDVITAPAGRPILVGEACRAAVTIAPDATMRTAADRMREHDTDRLVVVEDADHVIGVVTGHDLLRTITRRGNLLLEVVEQQVVALGAAHVQADVDYSGVVLLTGTVDSLDARDRLLRAVGALNGVTEVDGLISVLPDADAGRTAAQAPSTTRS